MSNSGDLYALPITSAASGEPLLLLSEIAEHTRNARADARASLFISDSSAMADPQAAARVTLLGIVLPVPAFEQEEVRRFHLARFPGSASYFRAHDFTLFTMRIEQVRFIGGFGQIHWLDPAAVVSPADPLGPQRPRDLRPHEPEPRRRAATLLPRLRRTGSRGRPYDRARRPRLRGRRRGAGRAPRAAFLRRARCPSK